MEGFNNVGSASHVGSSLSPIETAILILIGAFILIRITKKFLNRINPRPADNSAYYVRESSSSTSTGYTGGDEIADPRPADNSVDYVDESSSSSSTGSTGGDQNADPLRKPYREAHALISIKEGDVVRDTSDVKHPLRAYVVVDYNSSTNLCRMSDGYGAPCAAYAQNLEKVKTAQEDFPEIYGETYLLTDNIELWNPSFCGYSLIRQDDSQRIFKINDADFVVGFHQCLIPKKMLKKC